MAFLLFLDFTLVTNLYNIGSLYAPLASEFNETVAGLGILTSVFVLGRAVFELPGSLLAVRRGPKMLLVVGGAVASVPIILSAFSTNFVMVVLLRCIGGAGFGVCFPQILTLVGRNVRSGAAGLAMGLVFMTSNIAGIVGLFGYAELGSLLGWRVCLLLSGGLALLATVVLLWAVKDDRAAFEGTVRGKDIAHLAIDRRLLSLALVLVGIGGGSYLTWNFMVYYLQTGMAISAGLAGFVAGLAPAFALVAPLAGGWFDRYRMTRLWAFCAIAALAAGLAVASVGHLAYAVASVATVGAAQGVGFTVIFASVRDGFSSARRLEPFAFGWVDTISLAGPLSAPVLFSTVALSGGYSLAWLSGGAFTLVFAVPIFFLARTSLGSTA